MKSIDIRLYVSDFDNSIDFYAEVLGFELKAHCSTNATVTLNDRSLLLCKSWWPEKIFAQPVEYPFGRGSQFRFEVIDLEKIKANLAKHSIKYLQPPRTWEDASIKVGKCHQIEIADPDGYVLTFYQWTS